MACSRLTYLDQTRSRSSRMRSAVCAPEATTHSSSWWRFPPTPPSTRGRPRAQPGSSLTLGHPGPAWPRCAKQSRRAPSSAACCIASGPRRVQRGLSFAPTSRRFEQDATRSRIGRAAVVRREALTALAYAGRSTSLHAIDRAPYESGPGTWPNSARRRRSCKALVSSLLPTGVEPQLGWGEGAVDGPPPIQSHAERPATTAARRRC